MSIPTFKLNNGLNIPFVGLGTYKEDKDEVLTAAIKSAIKSGYRHFDCSPIYYNENIIGKAIKESIEESKGALKREEFFIVSKLWNTYHSKNRVGECLERTLKSLDLDYLDLYLIHWPMGFKEGDEDMPMENGKAIPSDIHYIETYQAMEELVAQGKTKSIGISNFNIEQVKDVLKNCKIRPACNQIEINPVLPNNELVEYCLSENIAVVAYAPLGANDRPWLKTEDPVPLKNPAILELANKYKKSPAQVILRWLHQRNIIVIPKSANPERLAQNLNIFDFELTKEDISVFDNIKTRFRFYKFEITDNHPLNPFKNE